MIFCAVEIDGTTGAGPTGFTTIGGVDVVGVIGLTRIGDVTGLLPVQPNKELSSARVALPA